MDRIIENEGRDATIQDITKFLTTKATAATHPIFGRVVNENKGGQEESKGKEK